MPKLELLIVVLAVATVLWTCAHAQARAADAKPGAGVRIEPIPPAPPNQDQYIGFKLMVPWIEGYVRVRFPENIYSPMGTHFLDNLAPGIERVSDVKVPAWKVDETTGALSYAVETKEGIHFSGKAWVEGDVVHLEYRNRNTSGQPQDLGSQICYDLSTAPNLGEKVTLDYTYAWFDGAYQSLNETTSPVRDEKFAKNGYNWVIMLYKEDPETSLFAAQDQYPWWVVDQRADYPIIARETPDKKHLFALTWDHTVRRLMTNTNIPCLHTDTLHVENLPDGGEKVWKGRVYLMENDPERLLERWKADLTPKP